MILNEKLWSIFYKIFLINLNVFFFFIQDINLLENLDKNFVRINASDIIEVDYNFNYHMIINNSVINFLSNLFFALYSLHSYGLSFDGKFSFDNILYSVSSIFNFFFEIYINNDCFCFFLQA